MGTGEYNSAILRLFCQPIHKCRLGVAHHYCWILACKQKPSFHLLHYHDLPDIQPLDTALLGVSGLALTDPSQLEGNSGMMEETWWYAASLSILLYCHTAQAAGADLLDDQPSN